MASRRSSTMREREERGIAKKHYHAGREERGIAEKTYHVVAGGARHRGSKNYHAGAREPRSRGKVLPRISYLIVLSA